MKQVGSEQELCTQLAHYLRLKYPNVIFHFDFGSGTKLSMAQARRQRALNDPAFPDLFIAQPATRWGYEDADGVSHGSTLGVGTYNGLFIELKREGTKLKKLNGEWVSDHVAAQANMLEALAELGYIAQFCCGFSEAQAVIDSYLANTLAVSAWSR